MEKNKTLELLTKELDRTVDKEISKAVEQLLNAIYCIEQKYGISGKSFSKLERNEKVISCITNPELKTILFNYLKEKYGDDIIRVKSRDIIDKFLD